MKPPKVGEDDFYILPQLEVVTSLEEKGMFNSLRGERTISDIKEIYSGGLSIVVAEPGNGKSRLLKEIVLKANKNNYEGLYLDLKSCRDKTINQKIEEIKIRSVPVPKTNKAINATKDFFFTEHFHKAKGNRVICLDALDEVKNDDMYEYIDKIKQFCSEYPKIKVVVSCRDYIYREYETIMKEKKPTLIEVKPFSGYMVIQYLTHYGFKTDEAKNVVNHFFPHFNLTVISSPRILEIFTIIAQKEGIPKTLRKNKADLLELFIYGKLDEEAKKHNSDKKDLIKRVLEKLALVMEIHQSNEIKSDDLITFIDDVKSNLLNQIKFEDLVRHSIIVPGNDGASYKFENAEFQEYLAAKEITRLGRTDQILFDLVVEKRLNELIPTWGNTMKYFFELEPTVQPVVIDFICRKNNFHNSDLLEQILISDDNYLLKIPLKEREKIFIKLIELFQSNSWFINYRLVGKLAQYFSPAQENILRTFLISKNETQQLNAIALIDHLFEIKKLDKSDFYKKELTSILRRKKTSNNLKAATIKALGEFKDFKIIKNSYRYFETADSHAMHSYLSVITDVDPNNPFTIDLIFKNAIEKDLSTYPAISLDKVTTLPGISYYLQKLLDEGGLGSRFNVSPPDSFVIDAMIKNISNVYNKKIKDILKRFLLKFTRYGRPAGFIHKIFDLLVKNEKDILFELIDDFKKPEDYTNNWYTTNEIFAMLINKTNVVRFIKKTDEIPEWKPDVLRLMTMHFLGSSDPEKKAIIKLAEPFFKKEFKSAIENHVKGNDHQKLADIKRYQEFKIKLQPKPGQYLEDLFKFYDNSRELLKPFITDEDRKRIKYLLEKSVLGFKFSNAKLTITKYSESGSEFTFSSMIKIFEDALPLFEEFGIDLAKYRKNLVESLPYTFGYGNSGVNALFLLGDLQEEEINWLIKFYKTPRPDDLIVHNIDNLFTLSEKFRIIGAVPLLKQIVEDPKYKSHSRTRALKLIQTLEPDNDFYFHLFTKYEKSDKSDERQYTLLANEFLIINEGDYKTDAIKWRMKLILDNPESTDLLPGTDRFFLREFTKFDVDIRKPLNMVNDPQYTDLYLNFLLDVIKMYSGNVKYRAYANHIWDVVFNYIDNLKSHRDYAPYEKLENTVSINNNFEGFKWLQNRLFTVKINYLIALSKPANLSDCIKEYNRLKSNQYTTVATAKDFYFIINDIMEKDIKNWIGQEGAYKLLAKTKQQEKLIQKTIKGQFELGLLRRHFRESEIRVVREEQLINDRMPDFVISHGFIGQVTIEIKLTGNKDLSDKNYYQTMLQYINGTKSDCGVLLIFQTEEKPSWASMENRVKKQYEKHFDKIKVIGMNCTNYK